VSIDKGKRRSGIVEKSKERRCVEYLVVGYEVTSHSSSSSKCAEGKVYNEKMQFVQTIIYDIYRTGAFVFEFLHKSKRNWCARE
jgi:hypothetical protein